MNNKIIITLLLLLSILTKIYGENAGILPFAYIDGKLYFLFGLEHKFRLGGYIWNDFGGICDNTDINDAQKFNTDLINYCAARETTEETRYVFGNKLPLPKKLNQHSQQFKNSISYWLSKITKRFAISKPNQPPFYYQHFALVDYIDAAKITHAPTVPHYEKEKYIWIPADKLMQTIDTAQRVDSIQLPIEAQYKLLSRTLATTLKYNKEVRDYIETLIAQQVVPLPPQIPPSQPQSVEPTEISTSLSQLHKNLTTLQKQLSSIIPE